MEQQKKLINLYIDGELGTLEAQEVERMIASDSDLQQYFKNITRLNGLLNSAYELPKNKANTSHITAAIPKQKPGFLKGFSDINWMQPMALAASVAAVMVVNNYMFNTNGIDLSIIEKHITMTRYDALENKLSNESLSWNDSSDQYSVVVTPTKTYKAGNGVFCREYKEVINSNGEITSREGLACREKKNYWPSKAVVSDLFNQG